MPELAVDEQLEAVNVATQNFSSPRRGGRKPADESRADELRERLLKWSYFPASARPSLRVLAKALQTNHQLLSHLLVGLEEWEREKDLERCRVVTKLHGIVWTEAQQMKVHLKLCQSRRKIALSWVKDMPRRHADDARELYERLERIVPPGTYQFEIPDNQVGRVAVGPSGAEESLIWKICSKLMHPSSWAINDPGGTIQDPHQRQVLATYVVYYGRGIVAIFHKIIRE